MYAGAGERRVMTSGRCVAVQVAIAMAGEQMQINKQKAVGRGCAKTSLPTTSVRVCIRAASTSPTVTLTSGAATRPQAERGNGGGRRHQTPMGDGGRRPDAEPHHRGCGVEATCGTLAAAVP
jgi:hypothetical protein